MISKRSAVALAALICGAIPANAGVVLEQARGLVLVSQRDGAMIPAAAGAVLPAGTRVHVKAGADAKGSALLRFSEDCAVPLSAGQIFTITEQSPCSWRGQFFEGGGGTAVIGIGALGAMGLIAGLGAFGNSTSKPSLVIPPTLSH